MWGALLDNARQRGVLLQNASIRCSASLLQDGYLAGKPAVGLDALLGV